MTPRGLPVCVFLLLFAALAGRAQQPRSPERLVPLHIALPKVIFREYPNGRPPRRAPEIEIPPNPNAPPLMVPAGTVNVAFDLPVTSSDAAPLVGSLDQITDDSYEGGEGEWVELHPGLQWIQVDLKEAVAIHAIAFWHQFSDERVYRDVIVQVCDRPSFDRDVRTLFNNDRDNSAGVGKGADREYLDTDVGRLIDARGVRARYVRLYTRGSRTDDENHWSEVQVYAERGPLLTTFADRRARRHASADDFLRYAEFREPGSVRRDDQDRVLAGSCRTLDPLEFSFLVHLPSLEELRVPDASRCWTGRDGSPFVAAAPFPRLRKLDVLRNPAAFGVLKHYTAPALEELDLPIALPSDLRSLADVGKLKTLRAVHLVVTVPDTIDLAPLAALPRLTTLSLASSEITDQSLPYLRDLATLEDLDLSRTRVTDAALPKLQALKNLRRLNLSGTAITDAGVPYLYHVPHLQALDLSATRVTPDALARLRARRPALVVRTGP